MTSKEITKGYKYMNSDDTTLYNTKWGNDVTHETTGNSWELCSNDVIHYYKNKHIAALLDPAHGNYTQEENYIMRICTIEGREVTDGFKYGAKKVTTGRKVKPVKLTLEQRAKCAIRISLLVYNEPSYVNWAQKWLSGKDRSYNSACAIYEAVEDAYDIYDASSAAVYAAYVATRDLDDPIVARDAAWSVDNAVYAGADEKQIEKIIKMVVGT